MDSIVFPSSLANRELRGKPECLGWAHWDLFLGIGIIVGNWLVRGRLERFSNRWPQTNEQTVFVLDRVKSSVR